MIPERRNEAVVKDHGGPGSFMVRQNGRLACFVDEMFKEELVRHATIHAPFVESLFSGLTGVPDALWDPMFRATP